MARRRADTVPTGAGTPLNSDPTLTALTAANTGAMNSVANGKIKRMTTFRCVYVQSAAGDAGGTRERNIAQRKALLQSVPIR